MRLLFFIIYCVCGTFLFSEIANDPSGRAEQLPRERFKGEGDHYREGYLQALVDIHYYEFGIKVRVDKETVYLSNLPNKHLLSQSIISFVGDFPGIKHVDISEKGEGVVTDVKYPFSSEQVTGLWFPQSNLLFPALVADPLHISYSGSLRFNDEVLSNTAAFISFGDRFPIYRWLNVGPFYGDMEIGIEGAAWAYFNMSNEGDLINTDYYAGIPLTYAFDNWAFRLRMYHVSAHLGDEYIITHPDVTRLNYSFEALDFFALYDFSRSLRGYGGIGWVVRSDKEDPVDPLYVEGGAEVRLFGTRDFLKSLYLQPFYAMHFRFWQDHDWQRDMNFSLGVELSKLKNVGRKMRIYAVYHDGQSYVGQFSKEETKYWGLGFGYGF
jgi:hypothetical protein